MASVNTEASSQPQVARLATASQRPDDAAISALAKQLGIEESEEDQFAWIAEVGLQTSLPPRWTSEVDPNTGNVYYIDNDLQDTTWLNPLVPHLTKVIELGRLYLSHPTVNFFEEQTRSLWHEHKQELDCWHGPFSDADGNNYFVNSRDGISSWQDPRVGEQYIFELQSGLLSHLQKVLVISRASTPDRDSFYQQDEYGAEILTLSRCPSALRRPPPTRGRLRTSSPAKPRSRQDLHSAEDHALLLKKMQNAADWVHEAAQEDQEAQRLQLSRKVEERRQRKLIGKL